MISPQGPFGGGTHILVENTADTDMAVVGDGTDLAVNQNVPRDGARVQFDQFYREEMPALARFVRRYGADAYAAADAAHDAFTEVYPQWEAIEHPRAWLRLVACRIYYRRRLREIPVEEVPDRPVIYEDLVEIGEQARRVYCALAALPERQRQVMAWHLDGYANSEIARHLSISDAAVRQNLCRGRQALKKWLGLDQEGDTR